MGKEYGLEEFRLSFSNMMRDLDLSIIDTFMWPGVRRAFQDGCPNHNPAWMYALSAIYCVFHLPSIPFPDLEEEQRTTDFLLLCSPFLGDRAVGHTVGSQILGRWKKYTPHEQKLLW